MKINSHSQPTVPGGRGSEKNNLLRGGNRW